MGSTGLCCFDVAMHSDVFVYKQLRTHQQRSTQERRTFIADFSDDGDLCPCCFRTLHGIPASSFSRIRKARRDGDRDLVHGNKGTKKPRNETLLSEEWLKAYAARAGDFMPDCDQIHLPDFTWRSVWKRAVAELGRHRVISEKQFTDLAKTGTLSRIKIRRSKRFSKCEHCVRLKELIKQSVGQRKLFWKTQHDKHNTWQMRERKKQAKHVEKAVNPDTRHKYMVIEMDNMDNAKTALPRMPRPPKDLDGKDNLITHVTGVHVPGDENTPFRCYTWHDRFPTGSDTVITILLKVLSQIEGPLPPTLYLHMDNCWRENKNKYMLAISHLLVHTGVFKKVKMCFLPVGHTHNIVDQMFSRFSEAIKFATIMTVPELHRVCRQSYSARACKCGGQSAWRVMKNKIKKIENLGCQCPYVDVYFEHVDTMACWGPHLLEHLPKNIVGISKPRCFRVKRDTAGVVRHHYRQQLQNVFREGEHNENVGIDDPTDNMALPMEKDHRWMPHNREGYRLFQNAIPAQDNIFEVPLKIVDTMALRELAGTLSPYLNSEQRQWWSTRIDSFEKEDSRYIFSVF